MGNSKKHSIDKKLDIVQEPVPNFSTENNLISNDSEKLHPNLVKLILKGKAEAKAGMGIPHEEVMRKLKLRYPFLK